MAPINSHEVAYDEVLEIQHHLVHLNPDHHHHHHKTLAETINSLFHVGGHNGSHSSSGNDLSLPTVEEEISEDLLIVLFTLVPLAIAVGLIFIIAVAIRKMRRAESLQEVVRLSDLKSSTMSSKSGRLKKSHGLDSFNLSSRISPEDSPPSPISLHEIRVVSLSRRNLGTQLSLRSVASSVSTSSQCSQTPSPVTSPTSSQVPPWYLHSTPYYRSQYHLNKLHRQLSYSGGDRVVGGSRSLQSFGSVSSLHHWEGGPSGSYSPHSHSLGSSDVEVEGEDSSSSSGKNKKSSKKIKKVFQMMNIPKRVKEQKAEKNRFNIYDLPVETREQLKQIYVY